MMPSPYDCQGEIGTMVYHHHRHHSIKTRKILRLKWQRSIIKWLSPPFCSSQYELVKWIFLQKNCVVHLKASTLVVYSSVEIGCITYFYEDPTSQTYLIIHCIQNLPNSIWHIWEKVNKKLVAGCISLPSKGLSPSKGSNLLK